MTVYVLLDTGVGRVEGVFKEYSDAVARSNNLVKEDGRHQWDFCIYEREVV